MQEIVINRCYGGFSLSKTAVYWLAEHCCEAAKREIARQDANLTSGSKYSWHVDRQKAWLEGDTGKLLAYAWHPADKDLGRNHPLLLACVRVLGEKADTTCSDLAIIEIPDGIEWEIESCDGQEWVAEKHRTWP